MVRLVLDRMVVPPFLKDPAVGLGLVMIRELEYVIFSAPLQVWSQFRISVLFDEFKIFQLKNILNTNLSL